MITAVPRLEKVYKDKIYAKGTELTGIKETFFWAIDLGFCNLSHTANSLCMKCN
jgi:long-chain acyl-CoA synthetase